MPIGNQYGFAVVNVEEGRYEVVSLADVRSSEEAKAALPGIPMSMLPLGRYAGYGHLRVNGEGDEEEQSRQGIAAVVEGVRKAKSPENASLVDIFLALKAKQAGYSVTLHPASRPAATSRRVAPVAEEDPAAAGDSLTGMANFIFDSLGRQPPNRQER